MVIRKATYADVLETNAMLTLLIQDEYQYDNSINKDFVVTNMYENYIEDPKKLILVAEEEGVIQGYLYGILENTDATSERKYAILDAIYVKEEYRRLGIADSLILNFKKWAKEQGCTDAKVSVCSGNTKGKNLYQKNNFAVVSETLSCKLD